MWRCTVCGYIHDGLEAPEKCPKCGSPKEKFEQIVDEKSKLIIRARLANQLHASLINYAEELLALAEDGLEDNLDPGCKGVFTYVQRVAKEMGQMAKAEIQTHIEKGKWG
ncbi:MAG: rubredoxin-like domain-containing protein [Bacillota bacterium]